MPVRVLEFFEIYVQNYISKMVMMIDHGMIWWWWRRNNILILKILRTQYWLYRSFCSSFLCLHLCVNFLIKPLRKYAGWHVCGSCASWSAKPSPHAAQGSGEARSKVEPWREWHVEANERARGVSFQSANSCYTRRTCFRTQLPPPAGYWQKCHFATIIFDGLHK